VFYSFLRPFLLFQTAANRLSTADYFAFEEKKPLDFIEIQVRFVGKEFYYFLDYVSEP